MKKIKLLLMLCAVVFFFSTPTQAAFMSAPKAKAWKHFQERNPQNMDEIDHHAWDEILRTYVKFDRPTGISTFDYHAVTLLDRKILEEYILAMQRIPISKFNGIEQLCYWLNLYNALTVNVILNHPTVQTIRDINLSKDYFKRGPWAAKLIEVEGEKISLDDIENRILRPIFRDPTIHYGLNTASLGSPNILNEAFTCDNYNELLDNAAKDYVNNQRGASFYDNEFYVSMMYRWYMEDFGASEAGIISHLMRYANPTLADALSNYYGRLRYHYNWLLNDPKQLTG